MAPRKEIGIDKRSQPAKLNGSTRVEPFEKQTTFQHSQECQNVIDYTDWFSLLTSKNPEYMKVEPSLAQWNFDNLFMNNKINKLDNLNKTLELPQELSGVFLPKNSPKQFDFMFIAEMPSMKKQKDISGLGGNFNVSAPDKLLQKMMIQCEVAGSYVTDIVKKGDVARKPTKSEIREWLPFLLKEIEIIQPKAIIVLSKRTYEASFKPFVEPMISKKIKVDYVFHYSQQGAKTNIEVEKKFSEVISHMRIR